MPVADQDSHVITRRESDAPYGCQTSVRTPSYAVPVRLYAEDGSVSMGSETVQDVSSTDCQYNRRGIDPRCTGCQKP